MANTITNTQLTCTPNLVIQHITLVSDGSEETDLVVYDSSAVATTLGKADSLNCKILGIKVMNANASGVGHLNFEFDATTDGVAVPLTIGPMGLVLDVDFSDIGGLPNNTTTGRTGDILLTTTVLDASDVLSIILKVRPY